VIAVTVTAGTAAGGGGGAAGEFEHPASEALHRVATNAAYDRAPRARDRCIGAKSTPNAP